MTYTPEINDRSLKKTSTLITMFSDDFDLAMVEMQDNWTWEEDTPESEVPITTGISLVTVDYNLNSPLIRDEIDSLLLKLQHKIYPLKYDTKWEFQESYQMLTRTRLNWENFKGSETFHHWVGREIFQKSVVYGNLNTQWSWIVRSLELSHQISTTFIQHLAGKSVEIPNWAYSKIEVLHNSACDKLREELLLFNEFHLMVLIMNSKSQNERSSLELNHFVNISFTPGMKMNSFICHFNSKNFGTILITNGFCVFLRDTRLMDRNMILMIKDTLAGRACSKLGLVCASDLQDRWVETVIKLNEFYRQGDEILIGVDNYAFDMIKMIEPWCNLQFMKLSSTKLPLIPTDESFSQHLEKNLKEFQSKYNIDCTKLINLITEETDPEIVALYFGAFRHWGHPFLDYIEGLNILHHQVTVESPIDLEYANILASDLAYKVLHLQFRRRKEWFVDLDQLKGNHILIPHIMYGTWPTQKQIIDVGPTWHLLPLKKCFEIPTGIDPSVLYADKSHSMNKSEVIQFILEHPGQNVPSKKVLKTALEVEGVDILQFLSDIDVNGLAQDDLVIGLKGKEREVKRVGRYFSLMSWNLRLYFVLTEFLIKRYYVPLFSGLTMADDFNTVIRKLLDRTMGQGGLTYEYITLANHFDYSKWNNTQRGKANNPVFKVMGQFLGLPNLFVRTHEFFEQSLIYYNERTDLMRVRGGELIPTTDAKVCWNGQLGGLEGLRQKGWSVVSLLVIERESKIRNTKVKVLAQGDNQVICTFYKLPKEKSHDIATAEIPHVWNNNKEIIKAISSGTKKLGLLVNEDETLTASNFLNYSKLLIFCGNMLSPVTKKYSRVTCITNDQIPSLGNVLSSVSTTCLNVAQFKNSSIDAIINYTFFGTFCLYYVASHSPLLEGPIPNWNVQNPTNDLKSIAAYALFLDPSLGGVCGMSLTRFLIRQFPDPLTESLSFWKCVYENSINEDIRNLAIKAGYPRFASCTPLAFSKLLENPMSLNLSRYSSPQSLLRDAVHDQLRHISESIPNPIFKQSIVYLNHEAERLVEFLMSIKPCFPRFLSEFKSATFLGITESIVGLFQNSRTLRAVFKVKFAKELARRMIQAEKTGLKVLEDIMPRSYEKMWSCSSKQADLLRELSWGKKIIGTTIPHPIELLGRMTNVQNICPECGSKPYPDSFISVLFPYGQRYSIYSRGPLPPYLGSSTAESTSLFHPWEKETDIPLLEKSMKLRSTLGWFVRCKSNLGQSIFNNLESLTGEKWNEDIGQIERTGCATHRFYCARQSSGGFAGISPNLLTYTFVTSDTLGTLNLVNHDFMYQSLLLYSQHCAVERSGKLQYSTGFHLHISCDQCIRQVEDFVLESEFEYQPSLASNILKEMSGKECVWLPHIPKIDIQIVNWLTLSFAEQSFRIGVIQTLVFSIAVGNQEAHLYESTLFPMNVCNLVDGTSYLLGNLEGLMLGSCYLGMYHRDIYDPKRPIRVIDGAREHLISLLFESPHYLAGIQPILSESLLKLVPHRAPPSYPSHKYDLSRNVRAIFYYHISKKTLAFPPYNKWRKTLLVFGDFKSSKWIGLLSATHNIRSLSQFYTLSNKMVVKIEEAKGVIQFLLKEGIESSIDIDENFWTNQIFHSLKNLRSVKEEVRLAAKGIIKPPYTPDSSPLNIHLLWGPEYVCDTQEISLYFSTRKPFTNHYLAVKRLNDPLISGLRIGQLATGAHYKLRGILATIRPVRDFICGGDGSGGMTAAILRYYPKARGIFNSLMEPDDKGGLMGISPAPPAALLEMPSIVSSRCVNYQSVWKEPTDLTHPNTWMNFLHLKKKHQLEISLIVIDAEVVTMESFINIGNLLLSNIKNLLSFNGSIIIKMYGSLLNDQDYISLIGKFGSIFRTVKALTTSLSSSFTSEFYLVCQELRSLSPYEYFLTESSKESFATLLRSEKSYKEEFHRAIMIKQMDLMQGIPISVIPPLADELFILLDHLGVEGGTGRSIAQYVIHVDEDNIISYCYGLLIICSNSIICTTRLEVDTFTLPSLENLQKHFSLYIGIWLYLSWLREDLEMYQCVSWWLSHPISYGFIFGSDQDRRSIRWTWNRGHIQKVLYKPEKNALSAQLIRLLSRIAHHSTEDWNPYSTLLVSVESYCRQYNSKLTVSHVLFSTGLFDLAIDADSEMENFNSNAHVPSLPIDTGYYQLDVEFLEGSWTN
ncbi:RNA-dependent RNA polymerase [Xinzhou nematode virus 4]|uniref:Replicase n=1 Tax=Xinzhou nematode virus 4 TaxID=1923772 RepID=A0A1L3KNA4_9RHAB|nr:RNA-dependent RNA polymerase [Xinzhou nematode virus 4]APG78857.1 RNA-dependent RNA polymerase [Xinzhou nematode virus 4]